MSQAIQTTSVTTPSGRPFIVLPKGALADLCANYVRVLELFANCQRLLAEAKTRKGSLIGKASTPAKDASLPTDREVDYAVARMTLQLATAELDEAIKALRGDVVQIGQLDPRDRHLPWHCPQSPDWGWLIAHHNLRMAEELLSLTTQWRSNDCAQAKEFFDFIDLPACWA